MPTIDPDEVRWSQSLVIQGDPGNTWGGSLPHSLHTVLVVGDMGKRTYFANEYIRKSDVESLPLSKNWSTHTIHKTSSTFFFS